MSWPPETVDGYSKVYESEYRAGDKTALMRMIGICAIAGGAIPKWAADIIEGAYGCAVSGEIQSWDEVFGKPISRKKARKWMLRERVYLEVLDAHCRGKAIDDLLFERIGMKLKIGGKTKVKELYGYARKEWGNLPATRVNAGN
jgi:hypothetical protein